MRRLYMTLVASGLVLSGVLMHSALDTLVHHGEPGDAFAQLVAGVVLALLCWP